MYFRDVFSLILYSYICNRYAISFVGLGLQLATPLIRSFPFSSGQLEMDGKKVELPELEGIVILNINSWCGGCGMWPEKEDKECPPSWSVNHLIFVK